MTLEIIVFSMRNQFLYVPACPLLQHDNCSLFGNDERDVRAKWSWALPFVSILIVIEISQIHVYVRHNTGDDRVRGYGTEKVEDIALKLSVVYNVTRCGSRERRFGNLYNQFLLVVDSLHCGNVPRLISLLHLSF